MTLIRPNLCVPDAASMHKRRAKGCCSRVFIWTFPAWAISWRMVQAGVGSPYQVLKQARLLEIDSYGMTKVFETARMYTGDEPAIAVDGIYGVTILELG